MKTISIDLRERILAAYDAQEGTRQEIGQRFRVSLGMVKKLLCQRSRTGEIGPRHYRSGRKPLILEAHRKRLHELLVQKADLTLAELRCAAGLECSLPAIHYTLAAMGLTYKKRRSTLPSKSVLTLLKRGGSGFVGKSVWTRPGSCLSTNRPPKQI